MDSSHLIKSHPRKTQQAKGKTEDTINISKQRPQAHKDAGSCFLTRSAVLDFHFLSPKTICLSIFPKEKRGGEARVQEREGERREEGEGRGEGGKGGKGKGKKTGGEGKDRRGREGMCAS